MWVFLFHVRELFVISFPLLYRFAEYGRLGVPMFFVISGYVITFSAESTRKANSSAFGFLKRRVLRIYPAFWASVLVVWAASYVIAYLSSLKWGTYIHPTSIIEAYTPTEWVQFLTLAKVFYAEGGDLQAEFSAVNAVYWTLAIEMQFYIAVFFALCARRHYRTVIGVLTAASLLYLVRPTGLNEGLFVRFWPTFALGIGLAYAHKGGFYLERIIRGEKLSLLVGILIATGVTLLNIYVGRLSEFWFSFLFAVLLWAISPIEHVLAAVKVAGRAYTRWLLELFVVLGAMSYSVYLLHDKIVEIPNMIVRQAIPRDNLANGILTLAGTLVLCYAFYALVERRFMSSGYAKMHRQVLRIEGGAVRQGFREPADDRGDLR